MSSTMLSNAMRLIKAATGEEYGDGMVVTDICVGYAEPGYGSFRSDEDVIVFGNWNPCHVAGITRSRYDDESLPDRWTSKHPQVTMPVRLAAALERIGANVEWSDEWYTCGDCHRAVRASGDSYGWKPSYIMGDGDLACHECAIEWGVDALDSYVNDASRLITWAEPAHIESFGYVKWAPGDPQDYESGFHPGQDDDPRVALESILAVHPDASVVFLLDEASQFYIRFSAYVRLPDNSEEA